MSGAQAYITVYLAVAITFSIFVPIRTGQTIDTMKDVRPLTRVFISLVWPLYVVMWGLIRMLA